MFWTSRFICFGLRFLYTRLRIQNIRLRIQNTRLRLQKPSTSIEILLFVFLSATERHIKHGLKTGNYFKRAMWGGEGGVDIRSTYNKQSQINY